MANAKELTEKEEQCVFADLTAMHEACKSPEQVKQRMITAVQSLAFDLLCAIDEASPPEALEQSIAVAHQRINDYRSVNVRDHVADILRDTLSIDIIEQKSEAQTFVFSEDRERWTQDGTDKAEAAHKQITHAVLKKLKSRVLGRSHHRWDESYHRVEEGFQLRRDAYVAEDEYLRTHPQIELDDADSLSDTAVSTLRRIAKGVNERLHRQVVTALNKYDFTIPFGSGLRLTPKGERAIKYHGEKEAFQAQKKATQSARPLGLGKVRPASVDVVK